jgi:hypothetical protein
MTSTERTTELSYGRRTPIDTGLLRSQVDVHRFTLESVEEAHELLRAGANPSKVVVDVGHD